MIRSRAAKAMPEETTLDDLDSIKCSPWASSGVLRDVFPDVPRPILSWDEPPFLPDEERPVPRNMKITQDIYKEVRRHDRLCKMQETVAQRVFLAHSQDGRTRIEAASRTYPVYRDRAERAEQQKIDVYAKEVERIDHSRITSLEPNVVPGPPTGDTEIQRSDPEGDYARDAQRARGETEQDLSGGIPIPSADETLKPPEIPPVPSGSTPSSSTSIPISPAASSSSGVKRTYSESTALPNSPGASSGSGVKRAHGESMVNDDEEQPPARGQISALIAGLHGVNAAEDDETVNGDGIPDDWLSSWYTETFFESEDGD